MNSYVISLRETDRSMVSVVGGKGANLGELFHVEGISVPDGFCVTTEAYREMIGSSEELRRLVDQLAEERSVREVSAKIRSVIERMPVPAEVAAFVDEGVVYAVRSSATAEDLPWASFAGQQDSFLSVIGKEDVLACIRKCWASLFTERAVMYRIANGFDHRKVLLAVVVQEMVIADAAGVMFTADPVSSNRKVVSIDAVRGLGDALVSGQVNPDNYKVFDGRVDGPEKVLREKQVLALAGLGRKIEAHFGQPQDIEWCLADGAFYFVQSRPITTLFPIPVSNDGGNHVYLSVGHQQMMTDALKPLGLSIRQLTSRPMVIAGGRQFVDITRQLSTVAGRTALLHTMGQHDPLMKDALMTIIDRGFIPSVPGEATPVLPLAAPVENDPAVADGLIRRSQEMLALSKEKIASKSGVALFDFIVEDIQEFKKVVFDPHSFAAIMAGMNAAHWLNEKMQEWLGEKSVADVIAQSVPNNITSEMGLALLDVADVIRPYPAVVAYLRQVKDDEFLEGLLGLPGGEEVRGAIVGYLDKYGMRCPGEIDITRDRWSEKPSMLVPLLLSNIKNFEPGESRRKFDKGLQEAVKKEKELVERLGKLPDGDQKVLETKEKIRLVRNFAGYREYPKYVIVSWFFIYKQALMKEARELMHAGVIDSVEDVYYLSFEEFREVVRTRQVDEQLIRQRKEEHRLFERLTPPRVMTSDGEIATGSYRQGNLPAGAMPGLAVSSGVVEGRARVLRHMEDGELGEDDILVTPFTDPSWTPLFVSIKGLVTEVGGLMTHGAVIAREYGLPAVVGVENATKLIRDGDWIRVNGTDGYVEML